MANDINRFISIPPTPKELEGFTFVAWLTWYLDNEPRLSANHSMARVAQRLLASVESLNPGDVGTTRDDDWTIVKGFLLNENDPPRCGLAPVGFRREVDGSIKAIPTPTRLMLKYIDAFVDAPTKKPEPEPELEPKEEAEPESEPAESEAAVPAATA